VADDVKKRVLWLHTQPEHYHNCMMDALEEAGQRAGDMEYIAAFSQAGSRGEAGGALSTEVPVPQVAQTVFLRMKEGRRGGGAKPGFWGGIHDNWREDLYPLKYDIVIVAGYGSRTFREVIADCHKRGIPVAMFSDSNMKSQLGGGFKEWAKRTLKRQMLKKIIAQTDVMLTANRLGVEYWKFYGAAAEKVVVCPYYADYRRVETASRTNREEVLTKLGLRKEDRLILSAARLVPAKGLDLMIRAFLASGLGAKGYRYVIAGVGPLEEELKALCGKGEGGELGKTILFAGFRQPSEVLALMHHADVFVLPSVYEPHGIVVQESLAAGTPVIASDVAGAAYDLVEPGINGEIFRSGDWQNLQKKLEAVLADAAKLASMREASREKFEAWHAEFSPITVVERVMRELLGKSWKTQERCR